MFQKLLPTAFFKPSLYNNPNYVFKRLAGHSKWANIKHTKSLKDGQKSKLFSKLSQQIKAAIQEGGSPNPAYNMRLEQLVAQAKRLSMPVATIENVIKSSQKDKTQSKSHMFEIRGPAGCIILCEVFTPNLVKTRNDISSIMKKHMCQYSDRGGQHLFQYKGIIETELPSQTGSANVEALELATNHAIECEAEDVTFLEESKRLQFSCDGRSFVNVQKNLEKLNYRITNASIEYIPTQTVPLSDSDLEDCGKFFDKLESMDDVVKLYDNIA